jgi:hypothetical protein
MVACPMGVQLWAGVATVCAVSFLFNVGDSTFHAFSPSLLRNHLGLDTSAIGLAYTAFATRSLSSSIVLAGRAVQIFGPVMTCAAGPSAVGIGSLREGRRAGSGLDLVGCFPELALSFHQT